MKILESDCNALIGGEHFISLTKVNRLLEERLEKSPVKPRKGKNGKAKTKASKLNR